MKPKIIYLARHAKSSWNSNANTDFDRPLSTRGQQDAERMAKELFRLSWRPEIIISSPALRARQTCEAYMKHLHVLSLSVQWDNDFYAAYMVTLLHRLVAVTEATSSIMLVGHNPSMEDLLLHLCSGGVIPRQKNGKTFTTGNVMKISFNGLWKDLPLGAAELIKVLRPKALP